MYGTCVFLSITLWQRVLLYSVIASNFCYCWSFRFTTSCHFQRLSPIVFYSTFHQPTFQPVRVTMKIQFSSCMCASIDYRIFQTLPIPRDHLLQLVLQSLLLLQKKVFCSLTYRPKYSVIHIFLSIAVILFRWFACSSRIGIYFLRVLTHPISQHQRSEILFLPLR